MSKENLLQKIIDDATYEGEKIRQAAEWERAERLTKAESDAYLKKRGILAEAREIVPSQESRILTTAELEVKKIKLQVRQEVLEKAFEEAKRKLMALPKDEYLSIIKAMIKKEGENGDEVIISKNDVDRVDKSDIAAISKELGIKLTLSKEKGDFCGGIILRQNGCDKNMTFELELADIKDKFEPKLSRKLFKDE